MNRLGIRKLKAASAKDTEQLTNEILSTDDIDDYLENNSSHLGEIALSDELCRLLAEKGLKKSEVIAASGITVTYGYDLFSGYKEKKPSRNVILALSFGLRLDINSTQRLLKISGNGGLYPRIPRDSVIMFALKNGMTRCDADDILHKKGMETII
ncbi:MAG: XRE family transcriptional regulator [Oscillospiraceae bacterium]|nr:XRE family transcriptional regulator [Oscillospiraceae bacterium]